LDGFSEKRANFVAKNMAKSNGNGGYPKSYPKFQLDDIKKLGIKVGYQPLMENGEYLNPKRESVVLRHFPSLRFYL
jgi:hypothetical protein